MRCALSFDEARDLTDQNLSAWGELQSLDEPPAYREEDIKGEYEKETFFGYKMACDNTMMILKDLVEDEEMSEQASDHFQACMFGDLASQLVGILDNQEE